jgi:heme exporter protein D
MNMPVGDWSGSAGTDAFHQTMKEFNQGSTKHGATMVWLSYAMTFLALASLIASGVQIWIALRGC